MVGCPHSQATKPSETQLCWRPRPELTVCTRVFINPGVLQAQIACGPTLGPLDAAVRS